MGACVRVRVRVSDLFGAQQRRPMQQQAEFGVSLRGGGAADGGGEGDEQQEEAAEARGGVHLRHVCVCLRLGGSSASVPSRRLF